MTRSRTAIEVPVGRSFFHSGNLMTRIEGADGSVHARYEYNDPQRFRDAWKAGDVTTVPRETSVVLGPVDFESAALHQPYLVTFETFEQAGIEATSEEHAKALAEELAGDHVVSVHSLPYPTGPRLNRWWPIIDGEKCRPCPDFCLGRPECRNRSSCPQNHACDD